MVTLCEVVGDNLGIEEREAFGDDNKSVVSVRRTPAFGDGELSEIMNRTGCFSGIVFF